MMKEESFASELSVYFIGKSFKASRLIAEGKSFL